jgi:hypothetical protein
MSTYPIAPITPLRLKASWCWLAENRLVYSGGRDANFATYPETQIFEWLKFAAGPAMSDSRSSHASIAVAGTAFVFGGLQGKSTCLASAEKLVNGEWTRLGKMTAPRRYVGCAVLGSKVYLAGKGSNYLEEFDPVTELFRILPIDLGISCA